MVNKLIASLSVGILSVLLIGFFASAEGSDIPAQVAEKVGSVAGDLTDSVKGYVSDFVEKKGINPDQITDVSEVDFNSLPKEVNIENVDNSNLAIYKVDYNEGNVDTPDKNIFVITYSTEQLKSQGDLIVASDNRAFLDFGFAGSTESDVFLSTSAGVETSLNRGYVMSRKGSITSISTSLNIAKAGADQVEVIVYKNGKAILFGNSLDSLSEGVKKDYDIQSKGVVSFEPGDVISASAEVNGAGVSDITTLVEVTTLN